MMFAIYIVATLVGVALGWFGRYWYAQRAIQRRRHRPDPEVQVVSVGDERRGHRKLRREQAMARWRGDHNSNDMTGTGGV